MTVTKLRMQTQDATIVHENTYLEYCVLGLLQYADRDASYAGWLHGLISSRVPEFKSSSSQSAGYGVEFDAVYTPRHGEIAERRTVWLMHELEFAPRHTREVMYAYLHDWAKTREEPRAIVLGITIGVLPVGLMGEWKRKTEPMSILVDTAGLHTLHSLSFTQTVATISHGVVERGLHRAQGSTRRLEPELADWLFSDKRILFYRTSQEALVSIHKSLEHFQILHASARAESGALRAIAVSPSIFVEDLDEASQLERIPLTQ